MRVLLGRSQNPGTGWWWSLMARNGRVMGEGHGFNRRSDAVRSLRKFARSGIRLVDAATGKMIGTT